MAEVNTSISRLGGEPILVRAYQSERTPREDDSSFRTGRGVEHEPGLRQGCALACGERQTGPACRAQQAGETMMRLSVCSPWIVSVQYKCIVQSGGTDQH
ncbi:hypothetical protein GCM10010253_63840 [Streptomyces badius]|uniref:Uncharacterized protein n=1 Tax=Streptomyces badius TaxID=1941 RepID=A0ABQ2TNF0_STRBA|nr:hypothetical protein GCM10010253_63840 [Streptomyces badius]